jgi:hypothetical protein
MPIFNGADLILSVQLRVSSLLGGTKREQNTEICRVISTSYYLGQNNNIKIYIKTNHLTGSDHTGSS